MARWITVRQPFNYHWPDRSAVTHFKEPGDQFVKDEVADFAVKKGYATEGKVDGSSRSSKGGKPKVRKARAKKDAPPVEAADHGPAEGVDHADHADADRPDDGRIVDGAAG